MKCVMQRLIHCSHVLFSVPMYRNLLHLQVQAARGQETLQRCCALLECQKRMGKPQAWLPALRRALLFWTTTGYSLGCTVQPLLLQYIQARAAAGPEVPTTEPRKAAGRRSRTAPPPESQPEHLPSLPELAAELEAGGANPDAVLSLLLEHARVAAAAKADGGLTPAQAAAEGGPSVALLLSRLPGPGGPVLHARVLILAAELGCGEAGNGEAGGGCGGDGGPGEAPEGINACRVEAFREACGVLDAAIDAAGGADSDAVLLVESALLHASLALELAASAMQGDDSAEQVSYFLCTHLSYGPVHCQTFVMCTV